MKQTGPTKTAVLYMRVSTKRQADEGHSLEEQDTQLPEFCRARSIRVLETFTDPGESGRTMDRPGFNAMLQYCRKHRPSHVVVTSLSRFARNVAGQSDALVKLKSYGTTVLSMTEPNVDDTAAGRLALNIFGAYHQYFVDHLAERMASAARSTFEAGVGDVVRR